MCSPLITSIRRSEAVQLARKIEKEGVQGGEEALTLEARLAPLAERKMGLWNLIKDIKDFKATPEWREIEAIDIGMWKVVAEFEKEAEK